jgi:hypothetical protein
MDSAEFPATGIRTIAAQVTQFNIGRSQGLTNRFIDGELDPLQNATILKISLRCRKGAAPQRKNDGGPIWPKRLPRNPMALT